MKVVPRSSPLETVLSSRAGAATATRSRPSESFPEALRGVRAGREREPEIERGVRAEQGGPRTSEDAEGAGGARRGEEDPSAESANALRDEDTAESGDPADPALRGTGRPEEVVPVDGAHDEGAQPLALPFDAGTLRSVIPAGPQPGVPLPGALPSAAPADAAAPGGAGVAGALAGASPAAAAPAPLASEAIDDSAAALRASERRAEVLVEPRAAPETKGAAGAMEPNGKNDPAASAASVAAAARRATNEGATGSAVVAGPMGAEGETASVPARGAAVAVAPAASAAVEPGWFDRPGSGDRGVPDRAAFHLLARGADGSTGEPSAIEPLAASPDAAAAVRAARGRGPSAAGGEASIDALAPPAPPTAGARAEGSGVPATAAAAEASVADPGEPAELARRIYRLVRRSLARGEHELRIRLDPPRLGRVEVEMSIDDRRLGIRFTVESEEVRDTLKSHLGELQRSLGEHGFAAERVEVDLRQEGGGSQRPMAGRTAPAGSGGETGEDPVPAEIRLRHLGRTVDLRG